MKENINSLNSHLKIAIVGTGAATVGALRALEESDTHVEVVVFNHGPVPVGPFETRLQPERRTNSYYANQYKYLRKHYGFKFPPPKTHFGINAPQYDVLNWGKIWKSCNKGGLTNFWGGSVLPFTDRDLCKWPLNRVDLDPYYSRIGDLIGISGRKDKLNDYMGEDYINRPPIETPNVVKTLERVISTNNSKSAYQLIAGSSRLALETRENKKNRCLYTGECMTGCSINAIYNAIWDIERYQKNDLIKCIIDEQVLSIDLKDRIIRTTNHNHGPFDYVYICAGCIESTVIVMRSMGIKKGPVMYDNTIHTFPIFYLGKSPEKSNSHYFALTNLMIACVPRNDEEKVALVQVFPYIDHLWRSFVPVKLWRFLQPLANMMRERVLFGRLYVHSDYSQKYTFSLEANDTLRLSLYAKPKPLKKIEKLWESIRKTVNHRGFYIPEIRPIQQKTSSHYAGSFPLGGEIVDRNGRIAPGIFLCDSSVFTDGPASSPTFTIMANACRTVFESLQN